MTYFTDSPYERMMQEVPRTKHESEAPPVAPANKPCKECRYKRPVCIGVLCKYWKKKNSDHYAYKKFASN